MSDEWVLLDGTDFDPKQPLLYCPACWEKGDLSDLEFDPGIDWSKAKRLKRIPLASIAHERGADHWYCNHCGKKLDQDEPEVYDERGLPTSWLMKMTKLAHYLYASATIWSVDNWVFVSVSAPWDRVWKANSEPRLTDNVPHQATIEHVFKSIFSEMEKGLMPRGPIGGMTGAPKEVKRRWWVKLGTWDPGYDENLAVLKRFRKEISPLEDLTSDPSHYCPVFKTWDEAEAKAVLAKAVAIVKEIRSDDSALTDDMGMEAQPQCPKCEALARWSSRYCDACGTELSR